MGEQIETRKESQTDPVVLDDRWGAITETIFREIDLFWHLWTEICDDLGNEGNPKSFFGWKFEKKL